MIGYRELTPMANAFRAGLSYDGHIEWKAGSITIDWSTVAAVSGSPVTLTDGTVIAVGQKYLQVGQVMAEITATGLYGPYDSAASDGRQTLVRGKCGLLEETLLQNGVLGITPSRNEHWNLLEGGRVWAERILQVGTGTASLAAGPQLATLLAVLPRLQLRYA